VHLLHATSCGARFSDRQVVGEAVRVLDVAPREIGFILDDPTPDPHEPGLGFFDVFDRQQGGFLGSCA
jgi:hypothetical protein